MEGLRKGLKGKGRFWKAAHEFLTIKGYSYVKLKLSWIRIG